MKNLVQLFAFLGLLFFFNYGSARFSYLSWEYDHYHEERFWIEYRTTIESFTHPLMIVSVEKCQAVFDKVYVNDASDCDTDDGKLVVNPNVAGGTTLPIEIYYTYEGNEYDAGQFNSAGDNVIGGLKPGTYTDIRMVDADGCQAVDEGPYVIGPSGSDCLPMDFCSGALGAASEYNLMVFGTATSLGHTGGGTIQGRVAVGGNITNLQVNVGKDNAKGINLTDDINSRSLVVGGDINNSDAVSVFHGHFSFTGGFGGTISVYDPSELDNLRDLSGTDLEAIDQYRQTPPFDFNYVRYQQRLFSQTLQSMDASDFKSALVGTKSKNNFLELAGKPGKDYDTYIFFIDGTDLSGISSIKLKDVADDATIIVNVSGADIVMGSIGLLDLEDRVHELIFNFYEATSLSVNSFNGTILAPNATFTATNGTLRGQVIVNSVESMESFSLLNYPFGRCISPLVENGIDYGDAPASYGEASHVYKNNSSLITYLGSSIDYELAGFDTRDACGDDFDNMDDENGIEFVDGASGAPEETKSLNITLFSNYQDVFVNIWIDFNLDGVFHPQNERVVKDEEFDKDLHDDENFIYSRTVQFTIPNDAVCGDTYMRVRMESDRGTLPTGQINKGEVEDYVFTVTCDQGGDIDYGDALVSYGTAAHEINGLTVLGNVIDGEAGHQGTAFANGDDQSGVDDEDGVVFANGPLIIQQNGVFMDKNYRVTVNNQADKDFYLSAWVDSDANGEFDTQFINDQPFGTGTDIAYDGPAIQIPYNENICGEWVLVRFRLSDTPGVAASGGEVEGEVEDYALIITCSNETYVDLGALPVEWLSFEAAEVNRQVALNWATASETNNALFEIERSLDGQHFQPIGTQPGAGFSEDIQYYQFTDKDVVPGILYYRIKQVDFDGGNEYSRIVEVHLSDLVGQGILSAYPTPTSGAFNLEYRSAGEAYATFRVMTTSGMVVHQQSLSTIKGIHTYRVDLSDLPAGIYLYQWIQGDQMYTHKLIKN